jgi:tetratricopeptide (TPR) repeat protein
LEQSHCRSRHDRRQRAPFQWPEFPESPLELPVDPGRRGQRQTRQAHEVAASAIPQGGLRRQRRSCVHLSIERAAAGANFSGPVGPVLLAFAGPAPALNWLYSKAGSLLNRFLLAAVLAVAWAVRAATPEHGQLDASPTLFTVMAAINAAGFDADADSPNNHPLRTAVRKILAGQNLPSVAAIKLFFAEHHKRDNTAELNQYISFALSVGDPPAFQLKGRDVEVPPDAAQLEGLAPLLSRFYEEARIEDLWKRSQPAIEQMLQRYHGPVSEGVLKINAYLRNATSGPSLGRRFQIYVCPLAPPSQIQTRSYGNDYYVVITPAADIQLDEIRHAYLHYLLDPLATKNSEIVLRKRGLVDHAMRAPALAENYKEDFLLLVTESLIKAVEARLDRKPAAVELALKEGFVLAPYFFEALAAYEKDQVSMRFYFPDMVKAIDLKKEDTRLAPVQFLTELPVKRARVAQVEPPAPPPLTGAAKTLEEAEQLYTSRDLEKAKSGYLRALQETEDKPLHAKAYYGLARIAVLQRDPDTAERLLQKTLESSPEPQVKAWVLIYLGRLSDASGDRGQAAKHYQEALAIEGASTAAHKAAEQGVQQSFKK